jgi:hypothetical protein
VHVSCHIIDMHFEPSFHELDGNLCRIARHGIDPHFVPSMTWRGLSGGPYISVEVARLQRLETRVMTEGGPGDERLQPIYERLEELDPTTFEARAAELLVGLG